MQRKPLWVTYPKLEMPYLFSIIAWLMLAFSARPIPFLIADDFRIWAWVSFGCCTVFGLLLLMPIARTAYNPRMKPKEHTVVVWGVFFLFCLGPSWLLGYRGIPALLHEFASAEIVSAETTITYKHYSTQRKSSCRRKLAFEPAISNYGHKLCVSRSFFNNIEEGMRFNIYERESKIGRSPIRYELIDSSGATIAGEAIDPPYFEWSMYIFWGILLFVHFYSSSRKKGRRR